MSSFTRPLDTRKVASRLWELRTPMIYWHGEPLGDKLNFLPKGMRSDKASIPKLATIIVSREGEWDQGAFLHDDLYKHQKCLKLEPDSGDLTVCHLTRKECDQIFIESIKVARLDDAPPRNKWQKLVFKKDLFAIYWGLRIGGWVRFKKAQPWSYDPPTNLRQIAHAI